MNDRDYFESVAIKPSRIIVLLYVIVKQIFYMFLVDGYYWIPRGIAGVLMLILVFGLTGSKKLTNRQMSVLVPYSTVLTEIVLCAIIGGDRLTYIFLIGSTFFSLLYIDSAGLLIMMILSCVTAAFCAFGLGRTLIGINYTVQDELFNFAGLIVVDVLIFLVGKFSIGAFAHFRKMGRTFDTIIDTTPNYIAVVNDKARVEYISNSLAELLDIGKKENAVNLPFIDLFPTSDMKLLFGEFMRREGSIEDTFHVEINGRTRWFMIRSVTMGGSKAVRFFEWADITSIVEAQKAAEAAAQAKSSFLAKMSHEIRTPMNAIIGITELILRDEIPPHTYEHALSIKSAGNNLLSIINDVLDFSKIESGMLEIVSGEYLFASLINDVINIIRIKSMEKSIFFIVNLNSSIPNRLIGDEVRIRQILINLLGNAVKYTNEGFISMTIDGEIREDNTILLNIDISDSGQGIRPEDMDKLFGDFVQFDTAANKGVQGTGLGLAITKSLCQAMGGDITVYSEYGNGSEFTVLIPQGIGKYESFASVENPSDKTVLLYEPREIYADSIACSIDNLGVECVLVHDGEAFRNALRQSNYPFVFISASLFEDVKEIINELGASPTLVLLTEYGEESAQKNIKTIAMPVHSISIANILNDVTDNAGYGGNENMSISFSAPTARVLVVDDISTNLKVAEGLMAPYNMRIDTCTSGEAAVEMAQSARYDIIFMDHMMPGMDGIEATQLIRSLEGEYYSSVTIIALTANAISGVKKMFLQNGMNDFLAKPIETSKLNAILEQWIPSEKKEGQTTRIIKPTRVVLQIEGLDSDAGVAATGGSVGHYLKTLSMFSKDCRVKTAQIRDCADDADTRLFTTYVHALKSALYSIGAHELSTLAGNLETAGRNGELAFIGQHITPFLHKLVVLLENIDKSVSEMKEKAPITDKVDKAQLYKLKQALDEMDVTSAGDIIEELRSKNMGMVLDDALENIYQSFLMFEYEEAQSIIDGLINRQKGGL